VFEEQQYRLVIEKLEQLAKQLETKLHQARPAAQGALSNPFFPDFIKEAVIWLVQKIEELGSEILKKIREFFAGFYAPITLNEYALEWQKVQRVATGVSGQIADPALGVGLHWTGDAFRAYAEKTKPQSAAAARIGSIADKAASTLMGAANAGMLFYTALAAALAPFIAATVVAIAAAATGVGAPPGAAVFVTAAVAGCIAIGTATAMFIQNQKGHAATLSGQVADLTAFTGKGGTWPKAVAEEWNDATVTDGDADWSVKPGQR